MPIGRRLKDRRKELGLSVAETAKRAGLKPTTLYDLERGDQHSSTRLHALCKLLGLNPEWVETGNGPRFARPSSGGSGATGERRTTLHGMQISAEEVEFGIEWGKLEEPQRSLIREQVLLLVASQVRRRRGKPASDAQPDPQRPPKNN